jgi:hypothetical protein
VYDHPRSAMFFAVSGVALFGLTTSVLAQNASITASGFSQHWGTSNADYDLNGDGVVNGADLAMFLQAEGSGNTGQNTTSSAGGGESTGIAPAGTETPGAASVAAAGPSAPNFMRNAVGTEGARIYPGSGFAGPTSVPEQVGDANVTGGTAKAIARWDFIPYRTITSPTNIAVTAFHMGGIDRVSFSANGGAWVDVREMKRNPQSGVWEYFVTLDPADFADGKIEIRAIAWPTNGQPRALQGGVAGRERLGEYSMIVWNNRCGTLPAAQRWISPTGTDSNDGLSANAPMRTLAKAAASIHAAQGGDAGGGFINMLPGEYSWAGARKDEFGAAVVAPVTNERWLTVRRDPSSTGEVTVTSNDSDGAIATKLFAIEGLRFQSATPSRSGNTPNAILWIANCDLRGDHTADTRQWVDQGYVGGFLTQTRISNSANGVNRGLFVRDLHIENIGKDGLVQVPHVLSSSLKGLTRPAGVVWHCDVMQFAQNNPGNPNQNVIVYGFKAFDCRSQGLFARAAPAAGNPTWRDFAFVNYFSEFSQGSNHTAQWNVSVDHLVMWNSSLIGGVFMVRGYEGEALLSYKNVSIKNSVFTKLTLTAACAAVVDAARNHSITGPLWGLGATAGDPKFVSTATNDYRPRADSPLHGKVEDPMLPVDSNLNLVAHPANVGSFED